ncbi:MAG: non-homologous end-joining DNA ligase [Candidatus Bathyarchaeota archaeon]|nr:MAG: non-homologous end-joining DNA ligase [Candidatus Bathyarchaeota archaeon]
MQGFRKVKFTNLQKILYPELGIRKYQVIEYYIKIAPRMLDFLADRAISLYRFPDGIGKEGFYGKDAPKGKPLWVRTYRRHSETATRDVEYIVCNDVETLAWLANLAALEINIPLSRISSLEKPDLVFFDIDPEPPANFDDAIGAALLLKEKLDLLGLKSYIQTSGKKGFHVVLPIFQKYTFRQTRAFVHQMGKFLSKESDLIMSEFRQTKVPGTVYIDYMQNIRFKTMICPYSLRAQEQATIATPLEWREVKRGLRPEKFNIFNVLERKNDPWSGLFEQKQTLDFDNIMTKREIDRHSPSPATDEQLLTRKPYASALKEYTSRRDFKKTSEPMGRITKDTANIFIVQEHHARRLHYDFRLSREGVLKSWAVPKGIPETPGIKRLAIQTEDHPLEYGEFEGTIPKGEYGAGTVEIWDKGPYELKIWTEDKIEFSLRGNKLHGMYVLVKLKKPNVKPPKQNEWLLIKLRS